MPTNQLPELEIAGRRWYFDARLRRLCLTDDPHSYVDLSDVSVDGATRIEDVATVVLATIVASCTGNLSPKPAREPGGPNCPACGNTNIREVTAADDPNNKHRRLNPYRCDDCGQRGDGGDFGIDT
jgi:predicted RNA-binding Zn-ribbon protein involved in translation (DUF1610 family)